MSQFRCAVAAAALAVVTVGSSGAARAAEAESPAEWNISSFHATLRAMNDGRLLVHEEIVFNFGTSPGHGVLQYVHHGGLHVGGPDATVSDVKVTSPDGAPADTAVDDSDQTTKITVGRPGTTITGTHTYEVDFTVGNAVYADAEQPGTAALLWDVVDNWDVPISDVEVTVTMPGRVSADHCWAGSVGAAGSCGTDTMDGATVKLTQAHLDADQQLTEQVSSALGSAVLSTASPAPYPSSSASVEVLPYQTYANGDYVPVTDQPSGPKSHAGTFVLLGVLLCLGGGVAYAFKRAGVGGGGSYSGRGYGDSWSDNSSWSDSSSFGGGSDSGGFSGGGDSGGGSSGDSGQSGGW